MAPVSRNEVIGVVQIGSVEVLHGINMLVATLVVFAPLIVAFCRRTGNKLVVGLLVVFTSWTVIGWCVALVLALKGKGKHQLGNGAPATNLS